MGNMIKINNTDGFDAGEKFVEMVKVVFEWAIQFVNGVISGLRK